MELEPGADAQLLAALSALEAPLVRFERVEPSLHEIFVARVGDAPPRTAARSPRMSEILIVLKREFMERVRTRGFLLTTLLIPLFMGGLFLLPALMSTGGERTLVVVDEAPPGSPTTWCGPCRAPPPRPDDAYTYRLERVPGRWPRCARN